VVAGSPRDRSLSRLAAWSLPALWVPNWPRTPPWVRGALDFLS